MGLASPFVPDQEERRLDRSEPGASLDEVLGVRDRQASELAAWLDEVAPERLARIAPVPHRRRMAAVRARGRTCGNALATVLNEEWAHHGFCVRDLDKLSSQAVP